jgi:23S rRNA C2498 (ribose-2'-O)-methylase RlmM
MCSLSQLMRILLVLKMADGPRIKREKKTIDAMVRLYCRKHHGTDGELCQECSELHDYAMLRLSMCPFQENKSTCGKCLVHCYKPDMKEKVAKVMRYSGPRMLLHHPVLALHHVFDGRKKPEPLKKAVAKS